MSDEELEALDRRMAGSVDFWAEDIQRLWQEYGSLKREVEELRVTVEMLNAVVGRLLPA